MELGHGFLPRIDARNYKAVERALSSGSGNLFQAGLELPWAIAEGPWAEVGGQSLLGLCHERGTKVLIDTQAWRYREAPTFSIPKLRDVAHAPSAPLEDLTTDQFRSFVLRDLEAQGALGADAYLIPGAIPRGPHDDVSATIEQAVAIADDDGRPARPCFAFVGGHLRNLDAVHDLIERLPLWLQGLYIQLTPVDPMQDSSGKLVDIMDVLAHAKHRNFTVIAGRLAGAGVLLRALGVDASDAGLGDGERFDLASKVRKQRRAEPGSAPIRMPGGRIYVAAIGRSVSKAEWTALMIVPALRGLLLCQLPCCGYGQSIDTLPERGREHSLYARVEEAKETPRLPIGSALQHARQVLEQRRSALTSVTNGLVSANVPPLSTKFIENQLSACVRLQDSLGSAA